jgi:hypothetical protein
VKTDAQALRAALWAQLALARARRSLKRRGIEHVVVGRPPRGLPAEAGRGVLAVLRRQPHTCLERAFVLQAWETAHGRARDVVIGVDPRGAEFTAHAWLAGDPDGEETRFEEIMRVPPP